MRTLHLLHIHGHNNMAYAGAVYTCTISTRQVATCVHEQKAHGLMWAWSMGVAMVANKKTLFVTLMGRGE